MRTTFLHLLYVLALVLGTAQQAQSQLFIPSLDKKDNCFMFGASNNKNGPGISIGYARGVYMGFLSKLKIKFLKPHTVTLYGDLNITAAPGVWHNFRFTYGGQTDLFHYKWFKMPFRKTSYVQAVSDQNLNFITIGAGAEFYPGYYGKYFSFSGAVILNHAIRTHLANIPSYQFINNYFTGWYKHIGTHTRFGFVVTIRPTDTFQMSIQIGIQHGSKHDMFKTPPSFGALTMAYIFHNKKVQEAKKLELEKGGEHHLH